MFSKLTTNRPLAEVDEASMSMMGIQIAAWKGWRRFVLETDTILGAQAFKSIKLDPWQI